MLATLTTRRLSTLSAGLIAFTAAAAFASTSNPDKPFDAVAIVDRAQGEISLERDGTVRELKRGQEISRRDTLRTGATSRLSVHFNDGSKLIMGENALVVVADYMAEEGRRSGALILDLIRGAIRLVAEQPKQAPNKRIEVRTAAATLTTKGVDLWSGPVDGQFAILVMRGQVGVRNEAGLVTLEGKRRGTVVSHRDQAPEKPVVWARERTNQSLMTVAFK